MLGEQQLCDQIIALTTVPMNAMVEASMFECRQEMQGNRALREGAQQMHDIASSSTASTHVINNMVETAIVEIV